MFVEEDAAGGFGFNEEEEAEGRFEVDEDFFGRSIGASSSSSSSTSLLACSRRSGEQFGCDAEDEVEETT